MSESLSIVDIGFGSVLAGLPTKPHHHEDEWEFHYFVHGHGRFVTKAGGHEAGRGRIFFASPREEHDTVLVDGEKVSLYYLRMSFAKDGLPLARRLAQRIGDKGLPIGEGARHAFAEIQWKFASSDPDLKAAARHQCLALCYEVLGKNPNTTAPTENPHVQRTRDLMLEAVHRPLSLDELAGNVGVHPSYLVRLFRKATGLPPLAYFSKLKIETAQYLLRNTSQSVKAISEELHFCSPYYFSAAFRRHTGLSPSDFRKSVAGEE